MKIDVTELNKLQEKVASGLAPDNAHLITEEYNVLLLALKAACAVCNIFADNITSIEFEEETKILKINGIEISGGGTPEPEPEVVDAPRLTLEDDTLLSMNCETEGASIFYTSDGSEPTASTGTLYTAPLTLKGGETIKSIAVKGGEDSGKSYVMVERDADLNTVKLSSSYIMYYTTNGSTPTINSLSVAVGTALAVEPGKTYKVLSNGVVSEIIYIE